MRARKLTAPTARAGRTPPRQPNYPDEISPEQVEVIRHLVDPDGKKAATRQLLHAPGW